MQTHPMMSIYKNVFVKVNVNVSFNSICSQDLFFHANKRKRENNRIVIVLHIKGFKKLKKCNIQALRIIYSIKIP